MTSRLSEQVTATLQAESAEAVGDSQAQPTEATPLAPLAGFVTIGDAAAGFCDADGVCTP